MNNLDQLIGESIWNTYKSMAYLIDTLTENSRGLQRLKRRKLSRSASKEDFEAYRRKEREGSIRKLATELEGHAVGSSVDDRGKQHDQKPLSQEHIRGHKARGLSAESNPTFGRATSRPETEPGRRAARRAVARTAGQPEAKRRKAGDDAMRAEFERTGDKGYL